MTVLHPTQPYVLSHPRYRSLGELGRGSQGVVVRVTDAEAPERALVAKVYLRGELDRESFRSEFRLLARLDAPGLVRVRDLCVDEATNRPFLVEDFVAGRTIEEEVQSAPEAQRSQSLARLLASAAHALATLHAAGFVHGDLKPAHVKINHQGEAVLLDLGSAVAQASAAPPSATAGYLAPERTPGSRATVASDLYALGAVAFKAATGDLPEPGERGLRLRATWLDARVADAIEALVARGAHERPSDAADVIARVGRAVPEPGDLRRHFGTVGREQELAELASGVRRGVTYLCGPSGIGKSHLLRELWVGALLAGRAARLLAFGEVAEAELGKVIAFLHGRALDLFLHSSEQRGLLLLDGLDEAPREVRAAVEAFRCREREPNVDIVVATRTAPTRVAVMELGPLSEPSAAELAQSFGAAPPREREHALEMSRGNPGWLIAALGGAAVTREMAAERLQALPHGAARVVFAVALANGELSEAALRSFLLWRSGGAPLELTQALDSGLIARRATPRGTLYVVAVPAFARELVAAPMDSCRDVVEPLVRALLAQPDAGAQQLLRCAEALPSSDLREAALARAREQAERCAMPSVEMAALGLLLGDAEPRDPKRLLRLERLTRDTGRQADFPSLVEWLERAVRDEPSIEPLVLRRRAETAARQGLHEQAAELVARALTRAAGAPVGEALVHATAGALFLYRADWRAAQAEFDVADALLRAVPEADGPDPEELARLEHNRGVVALYAGRLTEAERRFRAAIARKRALGDLPGVRACLLNLGLTATKLKAYDEAESALDEAVALARSLSQPVGEAWSLCARCELELERKMPAAAEHWLRQGSELAGSAPLLIQTELRLLAARLALLRGDSKTALALLDELEPRLASADAAQRGRALLIRGEAALLDLPAAPRRAARLAARSLRVAREAALAELEQSARDLLRRARPQRHEPKASYPESVNREDAEPEWRWVKELVRAQDQASVLIELCRLAVARTNAERALVLCLDAEGALLQAWGSDLDGFALSNAEERFTDELAAALSAHGSWFYQREVRGGSRVAARAPVGADLHVAIVLEHRFRSAQFDQLSSSELERWTTLAGLALRLFAPSEGVARVSVSSVEPDEATRLPLRAARRHFPDIVGVSAALEPALQRLDAAIDGEQPVLIRGETGAGKELFARALHDHGVRRARPFVAINCAAIADSLFEAELFGHSRGAFTGAERARPGLLAEAEGGTLLLDEIGELSLARQATLLRLLETGRYRSVGSDKEQVSTARIVTATNRELERAVSEGEFRRDLFFRINVLEIRIPPLRERPEDVPLLAQTFLRRANQPIEISDSAMAQLAAYSWPGNVRELAHVIERLIALGARRIEVEDLPRAIRRTALAKLEAPSGRPAPRELSERDEV
ncbi:MAG TPA: sigma 54-interacting transcriptional regulator, partial [Polyangiaceae bacterium]|nr:sigma 54-interacting transcriptional regulator [Polyangiaceae bacterium]